MMSEMARDFFGNNPALSGPLVAMLLFTVVFALASVRALRAERTHVDRLARMPLEGEGGRGETSFEEEARHG